MVYLPTPKISNSKQQILHHPLFHLSFHNIPFHNNLDSRSKKQLKNRRIKHRTQNRTGLVVPEPPFVKWSVSSTIHSTVSNSFRCITPRLGGGCMQRPKNKWPVVTTRTRHAHKISRIEGSQTGNILIHGIFPNSSMESSIMVSSIASRVNKNPILLLQRLDLLSNVQRKYHSLLLNHSQLLACTVSGVQLKQHEFQRRLSDLSPQIGALLLVIGQQSQLIMTLLMEFPQENILQYHL